MKRFITSLACAAVLLMSAHAAWAGAFTLRAASADIPSASNCQRVTNAVPSAAPYTAMRCPQSSGTVNLNYTYPTDATGAGGITPRLRWINPDASAADNYCLNICMGVIKGGQSRNALDLSQCAYTLHNAAVFPVFTQNAVIDTGMAPITPGIFGAVIPNDTTGTPCTPSTCAGAELVIQIQRSTTCFSGANSAQNIDFQSLSGSY